MAEYLTDPIPFLSPNEHWQGTEINLNQRHNQWLFFLYTLLDSFRKMLCSFCAGCPISLHFFQGCIQLNFWKALSGVCRVYLITLMVNCFLSVNVTHTAGQ